MDKQEFKIYCSDISKALATEKKQTSKNQPLILEGVASTSDIDLEGDLITPECIENFKLQATNCNIHNNHNVGLDDVIGTVLEVLDSDSKTLKIKFSILPLFREHIEECIDNGVKLGLSIGGTIEDYTTSEEGLKIKSMMLHEISLTPLPANWNTMGTVVKEGQSVIEAKCLNGMCKQFSNMITTKNVEKQNMEIMETEKRYYTKDEEAQFMSEDRVVELINEALNNFANNGVTEERVAEIIDAKLKEFVEQAKALEKAEIEKAKKEAEAKAKKDEEEKEEEEPEVEEEEEVEEENNEKEGKKKSLTSEDIGEAIAKALSQHTQPQIDIGAELQTIKEELQEEISKAMKSTRDEIEKGLFDGLMKESKPEPKTDDSQLKKFLKTKSEQEVKSSSKMNVNDIAKALANKQ